MPCNETDVRASHLKCLIYPRAANVRIFCGESVVVVLLNSCLCSWTNECSRHTYEVLVIRWCYVSRVLPSVCSVTGLGYITYTASHRGGPFSIRRVLCGICGKWSGTGTQFSQTIWVYPLSITIPSVVQIHIHVSSKECSLNTGNGTK